MLFPRLLLLPIPSIAESPRRRYPNRTWHTSRRRLTLPPKRCIYDKMGISLKILDENTIFCFLNPRLHERHTTRRFSNIADIFLHRDVNNLIMDYLIAEGYPSAAEKFAMEANIDRPQNNSSIEQRVQIRDFIYRGDLQQAIELINDLSPEVCIPSARYCPQND